MLNPGAVEHHGLLRAASRASPLARERRSKQVNEGLFRCAISAVAGTTDRHPTRNPAQSAATILGPPRCRRMAASVVSVERCCSADRRQGHTEAEPRRVSASPTPSRSPTTRWLLAAYGRIAELAHRAGRPRSRSAKRAKPSTPSPQLLKPGAVEHHGLARAASIAAPAARARDGANRLTRALNAVVEPACCRTPPPSSRRQLRRGPRARESRSKQVNEGPQRRRRTGVLSNTTA